MVFFFINARSDELTSATDSTMDQSSVEVSNFYNFCNTTVTSINACYVYQAFKATAISTQS